MTPSARRVACLALLVFLLTLLPDASLAWLDKTHVLIVLEAIKLLQSADGARGVPGYEEIYAPAIIKRMAAGASDEDWIPPVLNNERSFRHYYDPDSPRSKKGVPFYFYYYLWGAALGAVVSYPPTGVYDGTLEWAKLDTLGNLHNWPGAISAYDYSQESKDEAYYRLGHVGHLLGDMADSDHATNAPHAGSSFTMPDDLDAMFGQKALARIEALDISPGLKSALSALCAQAYFMLLDKFLGPNRSENFQVTSYERLVEDYIPLKLVSDYFTPREFSERVKPSHVKDPDVPPIAGAQVRKLGTIDEFFNTMARKAKAALTVFGEAPPLALKNLQDYFRDELLDLGARTALGARWPSKVPEPIYAIPTIETWNYSEEQRYLGLAWPLIRESVEYDAGLFELFHDIVNHPPYVQRVEIQQEGPKGGSYRREWKDKLAKRIVEWNNTEYGIVTSRRAQPSSGGGTPFEAEEWARITVTFGPGPGTTGEKLDAGSVLVTVGGEIVPGRMTDAVTWTGDFAPKAPPEGQSEATLQIEITARDLHRHLPRQGLPDYGYELDSNPATVAKAFHNPPYDMEGYEPGADMSHSIIVKPKEEPEPEPEAEVEEEESAPRPEPPPFVPRRPKFLVWINCCGPGPGGRIHVGDEDEFKAPKRCREEWLFGMSEEYINKTQIAGPFETKEEAVQKGWSMISEASYRNVPGWGGVPFAKYGGVDYLIDEDLAKLIQERRP